jgi:hypothetical protein
MADTAPEFDFSAIAQPKRPKRRPSSVPWILAATALVSLCALLIGGILHSQGMSPEVAELLIKGGLVVLAVLMTASFYFAPSMVARSRQHRNFKAILALNILFGWTFIGWAVAMIWAFMAPDRR